MFLGLRNCGFLVPLEALEALSKSTNLSPHDAVTVMWQHFKAMKEKVARLTSEHLPFWRFVAQRREEWQSNAQLLNPDFQEVGLKSLGIPLYDWFCLVSF